MRRLFLFEIICFALLFARNVPAQDIREDWMLDHDTRAFGKNLLVGQVREQGTRLPISGVAVAIPAVGIEVKTDKNGLFIFPRLAPGQYDVLALSPEHRRATITATVKEGEQTRIQFFLDEIKTNPYETVVRAKRRQTTVSRVTLRQREMTTVPGTFGDPVRVVENLPGMARVPYVGGALLIRGTAPTDSGVFLDGIQIPIIYHFLGGPSVLNAQFLDRIDYYPGNADSRYGRLIAGVIDVSSRETFTEQFHGSLDVNLLNTGAFLNVPITKNISIAGAFRRSYIDALLPTILKAAGETATSVVPVYYDYQLRVDAKLSEDDSLSMLAFGSDDIFEIATNDPTSEIEFDLDTRVTFHRVHGLWRKFFGPKIISRLAPTFGFQLVNFGTDDSNVDIKIFAYGLREDLEIKINRKVTLRTGLDMELRQSDFNAEIPVPVNYRNPGAPIGNQFTSETEPVSITELRGGIGAYVDSIINIGKWAFIPGARFDLIFYQGNALLSVTPRLTARYSLLENTTLKGAVGMYSQAPPPHMINELSGNPHLQLEQAIHLSTGVEQQLLPALSVDAQFFYIHRYSMGIYSDAVRFVDKEPHRINYTNQGIGNSFGLELLLKHEVTKHFYGWLSYTLSRSIQNREPDGEFVRFSFDQTHILTLVASHRFGKGWETGLRFRLVSGRPETPILDGLFDSDGGFYRPVRGEIRSVEQPFFHQLDIRVEKTWLFDLWRLSVYLDVQNVYNADNPEATLWDYRFRDSGPLPGLPILPSVGIKGAF